MKIYLCDDEIKILNDFKEKVSTYSPDSEVCTFSSGKELLEKIKNEPCDILLLDIDMPQMDGMEVAKSLSKTEAKPLLVFVTGHDELVYESFQFHPFGFIRKQFFDSEIEKVLSDCKKELANEQKHFNFRLAGNEVCLLLSDILFFESEGNYLKLYTEKEEYRFRSTISAVENSLAKEGFLRIHKGFLVNQAAIKLLGAEEIELTSGIRLPVGKTYSDSVKQQFMRYLRS